MSKIILSGGTGFLGSHLVRFFQKQGFDLVVIKRESSRLDRLQDLNSTVEYYDTSEIDQLKKNILRSNDSVDAIIHAATDYGRHGIPHHVIQANVVLPAELLTLGLEVEATKFVNIDSFSSKIEGYPYLPYYHLSKNQFLKWAKKLLSIEKSNCCFNTLRLWHVYGTYDDNRKFIPFIIQQLLDNVKGIDLTSGIQQRDFVFIEDVISAVHQVLISNTEPFVEYEVGTGEMHSIKEMVLLAKKLINNQSTVLNFGAIPLRANEIMKAKANIKKLTNLGWKPQFDLGLGLAKTIDYYYGQRPE